MRFPPPRPRSVRWRPVGEVGLEHLDLQTSGGAIVADSVVVGDRGGRPYGARYRLVCGSDWTTRRLDLTTTDGRSLSLRADGRGRWTDEAGVPLAALDGCIDIDLAGTPFTNSLPIRRLDLAPANGAVELRMAYVPFDTFEPLVDEQRYACVEAGRLYRYEAVDRTFAADLPVDKDGLVIDYPTLFDRVPLRQEQPT